MVCRRFLTNKILHLNEDLEAFTRLERSDYKLTYGSDCNEQFPEVPEVIARLNFLLLQKKFMCGNMVYTCIMSSFVKLFRYKFYYENRKNMQLHGIEKLKLLMTYINFRLNNT